LELVWIPPGEFMMGSPAGEEGRDDDEGPQTRVRLSKGFWMGKYEVTQRQWEVVMGTTIDQQRDKSSSNWPVFGGGPDHPMRFVSWNEVMAWCRKASALTSQRLTLPTEAQWEYACRAGTTAPYAGDVRLDDMGWYSGNSGQASPVGQKRANAWGLYDMHGNVFEWCLDWSGGKYPGGMVSDPQGPESGTKRVLRGGSWRGDAWRVRSAYRVASAPVFQSHDYGFRVVLAAD